MSRRFAILVCRGPECGERRNSAALHSAFDAALREAAPLPDPVELGWYSCFGRCRRGPNVLVREILPNENPMLVRMMPTAGPRAVLYHGVLAEEARQVIEEHVRSGRKLQALVDRGKPPDATTPPGTTTPPSSSVA
jgi:(2Fe-2S) ferredoxin